MIKNKHDLKSPAGKQVFPTLLCRKIILIGIPVCHQVKGYPVILPLPVHKTVKIVVAPVAINYGSEMIKKTEWIG